MVSYIITIILIIVIICFIAIINGVYYSYLEMGAIDAFVKHELKRGVKWDATGVDQLPAEYDNLIFKKMVIFNICLIPFEIIVYDYLHVM